MVDYSNVDRDTVLTAHRARIILELLDVTGNDRAIADTMATLGLPTSALALDGLLDRLEAGGLIKTERVDLGGALKARVSALTRLGADVRLGRDRCDWVASPRED